MVYESDFYTSRRPYSRPPVSSYSVTHHEPLMGLGKGHSIPYIAHQRLTSVSAPAHSTRCRPSVIMAEMDRIKHKVRPNLAYRPSEDYLNSRSTVSFDDETRSIRAQTQALLKRIHAPLPRASRAIPVQRISYDYEEPIVPTRITSDAYIERLLGPVRRVQREVDNMSRYPVPGNSHRNIGKGHLACISFAGGRAFSRRRNMVTEDDRIRNDVTYLSHYKKNRNAAEGIKEEGQAWNHMNALIHGPSLVRSRFYKPAYANEKVTSTRTYSPPPSEKNKTFVAQSVKPEIRVQRQASRPEESAAPKDEVEDTGARMSRRKKEKQEEARAAEEAALKEEKEKQKEEARQAELARQEELAQQAALDRQAEMERKAAQAQEEELAKQAAAAKKAKAEKKAEAARQAEAEKQAEAARVAEAEKLAEEERQAEEARKAEAEKEAEAARVAEAERLAEEERQAEEARKAEAERLAEEERKAEAERQAAELAKQQEEELAKQEAELAQLEAEAAAAVPEEEAPTEAVEETVTAEEAPVAESSPEESAAVTAEEVEATPEEVEAPAEEVEAAVEVAAPEEASTPAAEESEPLVEQPQTPEVQETEEKPTAVEVESITDAPEEAE